MGKSSKIMSGDSMGAFLSSTVGMAQEELTKAKELHIRNSIVELRSEVKQFRVFLPLLILFCVIPLFIPFVLIGIINTKIEFRESKTRIENALATWKDDLPNYKELKRELDYLGIK